MAESFKNRDKWLEMLNTAADFMGEPRRAFEAMPKAAFPAHLVSNKITEYFFPFEVAPTAPVVIELSDSESEDEAAGGAAAARASEPCCVCSQNLIRFPLKLKASHIQSCADKLP